MLNNMHKAIHFGAVRSKEGTEDFQWVKSKFPFSPSLWWDGEPKDATCGEDTVMMCLKSDKLGIDDV